MDAPQTILHETDGHGTFSEFLYTSGDENIVLLAPHGGQVEPNTDVEAMLIGQRLETAAVWGTRGLVDGGYNTAYNRWHTTSEMDPLHTFPLYQQLLEDEYSVGVSLHVMSEDGIIVGGQASVDRRSELCSTLEQYFPSENIRLGVDGESRAGMKNGNFVNSLGIDVPIHIEQSKSIAMNHPRRFSRAIVEWINRSIA